MEEQQKLSHNQTEHEKDPETVIDADTGAHKDAIEPLYDEGAPLYYSDMHKSISRVLVVTDDDRIVDEQDLYAVDEYPFAPDAAQTVADAGDDAASAKGNDTADHAVDEAFGPEQEPHEFELPPLSRARAKITRSSRAKSKIELWKILVAVLICLLFAMGSYLVGKVYGATLIPEEEPSAQTVDEDTEDDQEASVAEPDKGPQILNILLLGSDQRDSYELGRTDTIILAAINLDTFEINLISIPRDTRTLIADIDSLQKINHAYATGGPERAVATVTDMLGVTVHYYMETNFAGFAKCVDILGGVDYNVERRMYFPEEGIDLMPGQQKLTGDKALQYVRWRGDPTADIGRVSRQQKFLKELLSQAVSITTIPKLPGLISALNENLETDMSVSQMLNLACRFAGDMSGISLCTTTLPGEARTIGGGAYWIADDEAVEALIDSIYSPPASEVDKESL